MNPRRLFIASCLALVTTAMAFAIRGDVMDAMGNSFGLTKEQVGGVGSAAFLGFAVTVFLGSPLCDFLGMRFLLTLAWALHVGGITLTIFAPGFYILWVATLLVGFGNGLVEAVINPLIATMYPRDKTNKLNILHAWWPGGQILAGVLAFCLTRQLTPDPATATLEQADFAWKVKMALIIISAFVYGILIIGQKFPATERIASKVSNADMLKEALNPAFLLWFVIMWFTAATELGPMQWVPDILSKSTGMQGILVLIYINLLMFVMRYFTGPLVHRFSALGLLTICSILSAIGLLALSFFHSVAMVFLAATIYAAGICYFWPTMLGVTSERFPKGGALLLGIMGLAGNLSIYVTLPIIGQIYDIETQKLLTGGDTVQVLTEQVGAGGGRDATPEQKQLAQQAKDKLDSVRQFSAPKTFRWVAISPIILTFVFGILWCFGGYKQVHLEGEFNSEEMTRAG
ncbi:MFS transporter [bacterium]|nr:MFS transporter [bacterium]